MPRNMTSDFSGMMCEIPPECQFGNFGKKHHLDNGMTRPRRRHLTLEEDETLKYLTHEEKDVLLYFEETIDALEDDLEDQTLYDSGIHCQSPRSGEENMSSHLESEEIIDLVRSVQESSPGECVPGSHVAQVEEVLEHDKPTSEFIEPCFEVNCSDPAPDPGSSHLVLPSAPPLPVYEAFPVLPPVQHPKLLRSVPTPLVIAQKISEKQVDGSSPPPISPREGKSTERKSTPASSPKNTGEHFAAFKPSGPPTTAPKPQRFPSNISITNAGEKEFSKTISKAAVSVQERKARVLANVNGSSFLINELEERLQKHELLGHSRSSSLRDLSSTQVRHEALGQTDLVDNHVGQTQSDRSLNVTPVKGSLSEPGQAVSNGYRNIHDILKRESSLLPSVSKTVMFKPEPDLVDSKPSRQYATKSLYNHRQPEFSLEMRKRSGSLPRPSGLRPQGVTVQFSGRGSTEEARREALRKLGLLKE